MPESGSIQSRKQHLRREMLARRDRIPDRDKHSVRICERLIALPEYRQAQRIHCYLPIRSEVDIRSCIVQALAHGQQVAVPVIEPDGQLTHSWIDRLDDDAFVCGPFGTFRPCTPRPADPAACDLILVPLVAFDQDGYRLGYGKGYYDRLLAGLHIPAVGVAFSDQEIAYIPRDIHDIPIRLIVTEQKIVYSSG